MPGFVSSPTPARANHILWVASKLNEMSCPSQVAERALTELGAVTRNNTGLPLTRRVGLAVTVHFAAAAKDKAVVRNTNVIRARGKWGRSGIILGKHFRQITYIRLNESAGLWGLEHHAKRSKAQGTNDTWCFHIVYIRY